MDKATRTQIEKLRARHRDLLEKVNQLLKDYDELVDLAFDQGETQGEQNARDEA